MFSQLRQILSWSSRNRPETLVLLRENFPHEKFEKLNQALKKGKGDYLEAVQDLNTMPIQRSVSPMQQSIPKKLKRPSQRQYTGCHPSLGLHGANMHPNHHHTPALSNHWNNNHSDHAYHQDQPVYMGLPQHYPSPTYVGSEPLTPILQNLEQRPNVLISVPSLRSAFQLLQQQFIYPWTPYQPAAPWGDNRAMVAVPLYELPLADLMDYDMSCIISVRMLPEWNKNMEDRHWDQVRRERNDALRKYMGEDRDVCTIM